MTTQSYVIRAFLDQLIVRRMKGEEIVAEVSMAKWRSTDVAKAVIGGCLQLHGGYGYREEYSIARRYRDIAAMSICAGTHPARRQCARLWFGLRCSPNRDRFRRRVLPTESFIQYGNVAGHSGHILLPVIICQYINGLWVSAEGNALLDTGGLM